MLHLTETCEPADLHLLTHVHTASVAVLEARCTDDIGQALVAKTFAPRVVDSSGSFKADGCVARNAPFPLSGGATRPT